MKDGFIKVAAASVPLRVADCGYNAQQCAAAVSQAKRLGVRILALPSGRYVQDAAPTDGK